jgi:quercetin dioxygenase-like cupin family protein
MITRWLLAGILLLGAGRISAEQGKDHVMITPDSLSWGPGPESLPAGAEAAVVSGDPKAEGLFILRLRLPAGYKVPPHWHPADEHVTVLSGSFSMGLGETYDEKKAHALPPGGVAVMPMGVRHFAFTKEGAVIQLHGQGPWGITYVNAKDDPRNKKKK